MLSRAEKPCIAEKALIGISKKENHFFSVSELNRDYCSKNIQRGTISQSDDPGESEKDGRTLSQGLGDGYHYHLVGSEEETLVGGWGNASRTWVWP